VTVATPETFGRDLRALLKFWEIKWRPRKGDNIEALVRSNGAMLTRSFESGMVFLPTFWHGERAVAALATLVDERKRTFAFYMTGRDESFEGPPAGTILHAFSIRHAIANGFLEYDFLRGNEPYKYSYGSADRKIRCVTVETRTGKNLGGRIDPRIIPDILEQATALHKKGQAAQAETGYRSILDTDPGRCTAPAWTIAGRKGRLRRGEAAVPRADHGQARCGQGLAVHGPGLRRTRPASGSRPSFSRICAAAAGPAGRLRRDGQVPRKAWPDSRSQCRAAGDDRTGEQTLGQESARGRARDRPRDGA
jgi:Acetyltransferase (GNAT) domain